MAARRLLVLFVLIGIAAFGTLWSATPASAASADIGIDHDSGTPDINSGPRLVQAGGETQVPLVAVAPPEEIGSWTIDIHYDDTVLDATACAPGAGLSNICNPNFSSTEVRSVGADVTGVGGTSVLAFITFDAIGSAGACSDLTLEVVTLTDPASVDLDPIVTHGEICIVPPASADVGIDHNGGAPDINGGPALVLEGGAVTVGLVAVAPSIGLGAWEIDIHYSNAILSATDCTPGAGFANLCNELFSPTEVRDVGADVLGLTGTVNLMDAEFTAIAGRGNCSNLTVEVEELSDPSGNAITPVALHGQICIVACADVTGDGNVRVRDVLRIFFHVLRGQPYDPAFDLNGDQAVDFTDVLIALRQLRTSC